MKENKTGKKKKNLVVGAGVALSRELVIPGDPFLYHGNFNHQPREALGKG